MPQRYEYLRQPVYVSHSDTWPDGTTVEYGFHPNPERTVQSLKEAMDEQSQQGWRAIAFIPIAGGRANVNYEWKTMGGSAYGWGWGYGFSPTTYVLIVWEREVADGTEPG